MATLPERVVEGRASWLWFPLGQRHYLTLCKNTSAEQHNSSLEALFNVDLENNELPTQYLAVFFERIHTHTFYRGLDPILFLSLE